jgi:Flp pilus assembly protein TadG
MTPRFNRLLALAPARRFAADQRGVSAIEFAYLLPVMLTLYIGGVEISDAVSADRKNTLVAHTVGDLVAAVSNVTTANMTDVFNSDGWVAYPYSGSNLTTKVVSVCIDTQGRATVSWSLASDGTTPYTQGGAFPNPPGVPPALATNTTGANISYIWGQSTYTYRPLIGYAITGTITMKDQFFLAPRQSCSVTLNGNSATKCC